MLHVSLSITRTARLCTAETGDEKQQNTKAFGYMFETATITAMHGLMSYRFPTAVREILKGLLR